MHRLKAMEDNLITYVQSYMSNLYDANTAELGQAIDMIKDLKEAEYYCAKTDKIMEEGYQEEYKDRMYYPRTTPTPDYRPANRSMEDFKPMSLEMRDKREGRSPIQRKNYIESRELHHDDNRKMKELDKYLQELCDDIIEMIEGATPQEKQLLERKLTTLAQKVNG